MRRCHTDSLLLAAISLFAVTSFAQNTPRQWNAKWIAAAAAPARDYSVVYFRKSLSLASAPEHFVVDVSGDTRFELHVNGRRVGAGPALADVQHWRYETFDLAPYLKPGENQIAAVVWNFGTLAPIAQFSAQTGFLLRAEDASNAGVDTGETWQATEEKGRTAGHLAADFYYAAAPPEVMDGRSLLWDWDKPTSTASWAPVKVIGRAGPRGAQDSPTRWILERDELPQMQYKPISAGHVVRVTGMPDISPQSLDHPVVIPAHSEVTLLLDRDVLTTAFPNLELSGGRDASVKLTYSEALYDAQGKKGNRNEINGRHIAGISDEVISDGAASRFYRSLWWRAWRYVQLDVSTAETPLTINSFTAFYTAYPFTAVAHFESNDPELARIWETGWRTAQVCSHETYMDTPYWEELQYVGDARIQALISYAVTGDDRLGRQAIQAYRDSQLTDGLTESRYPSSLTQVIPPFSLVWIGMLHDFWLYRDDPAFVSSVLPATRGVLDWFAARQRQDGLLGRVEWWPFVDWSPPLYDGGVPPQDVDGGSSALTLQYIEALHNAIELEDALGQKDRALRYRELSSRASSALMSLNWDPASGLLADTPARKSWSQQANSLGVLLDVIPKDQQQAVMEKVLASSADPTRFSNNGATPAAMSQASYYFRFYVARAMVHAGLGDRYLAQLAPWRGMLALGLSTWAEQPEPTRSDSHAWSAHPTLDLLTIVGGISPGSSGFNTVQITPHLGSLERASATMPTPKGLVEVRYRRVGARWKAAVLLPPHLPGELRWRDRLYQLHAGAQEIDLP